MGAAAGSSPSNSSAASSRSGDAGGSSGTGKKVFNFGANPNTGLAGSPLTNPVLIIGVVVVLYLVLNKRKK